MVSIGDMKNLGWLSSIMKNDGELAKYAKHYVEVMGKLDAAHYEQVLWVQDINKWWDMVLHPIPGQVLPSVEMIESGKAAARFREHIDDICFWIAERDAQRNKDVPRVCKEEALNRIDVISSWLKRNGLTGVYKPIRDMLADAVKRQLAANEVAKKIGGGNAGGR